MFTIIFNRKEAK